ncbi:MAG: hypothetical protein ABEI31_00615 [Halodesulfurarchaeum sp.]
MPPKQLRVLGLAVTVLSALGYVAGVLTSYPGRALSVTGLMVGITVWAIAGPGGSDG